MKINLKDFVAGALAIENNEGFLEELLKADENLFNRDSFTEYLLKDMELIMEMINTLIALNQDECEEIQRLIARYSLYCYISGSIYGTTECFNESLG